MTDVVLGNNGKATIEAAIEAAEGGGGSSGFQILTYDFAWDTPGLQDPNDWGVTALTVPVGAYIELEVLVLIGSDNGATLYAALGEANQDGAEAAAEWQLTPSAGTSAMLISAKAADTGGAYALSQSKGNFAKSITADTIFLATVAVSSPMTQGAWRLVAKVYS